MVLGPVLSKVLMVALAYTWPAYNTYKAVSMGDQEATWEWSIYWTILGFFLSAEWVTDFFLWWLPLYHESKLILLILMWHPRIKGAQYVFGRFLQPLLAQHEHVIDSTVDEVQARFTRTFVGYFSSIRQQVSSNAGYLLESMRAYSEPQPPGQHHGQHHIHRHRD